MIESRIEIIAVICMLITGISHVVRPRAWVEFFIELRERGEAGVIAIALLHLPLAVLIIVFHPRWTGIPAVLTVLGCAWMTKAFLYFVFPRIGMMSLRRVSATRAHEFVVAGSVLIALAALISYPHLVR